MEVRNQNDQLIGWLDRDTGAKSMGILRQVKVPPEEWTVRCPEFEELVIRQREFRDEKGKRWVWVVDESTREVFEKLPEFRPTGRVI